jgi:small subunit ribosomal protein S9
MSKKKSSVELYHGVGRRKGAVARVWLKPHAEAITVNGKSLNDYFPTSVCVDKVNTPLKMASYEGKVGAAVNVFGGGFNGQADAVKLAVARALLVFDPQCRPALKAQGLLKVDARVKERKKPGQKGARKKFQFVKR